MISNWHHYYYLGALNENTNLNIMKTQNTKLQFSKSSIVELNDKTLQEINGGSLADVVNAVHDAAYAVSAAAVHAAQVSIAVAVSVAGAAAEGINEMIN